jgi:hypothetical protein
VIRTIFRIPPPGKQLSLPAKFPTAEAGSNIRMFALPSFGQANVNSTKLNRGTRFMTSFENN